VTSVSQPLRLLLSQLPQPGLHVGAVQLPPLHVDPAAFAFVHGWPQPPQFATLERVLVSQPFQLSPSQLPQLGLHTGEVQAEVWHTEPEALALVQGRPHALQLAVVEVRSVSQPFVGLASQSPKPAVQLGTQMPATQEVPPCWLVQTLPQPPQLLGSVRRLTSQPFQLLRSQLAKLATQVGAVQLLLVQTEPEPFAFVHTAPQLPQFVWFEVTDVSQPFSGWPSQSP
jgi:hypothetical protein